MLRYRIIKISKFGPKDRTSPKCLTDRPQEANLYPHWDRAAPSLREVRFFQARPMPPRGKLPEKMKEIVPTESNKKEERMREGENGGGRESSLLEFEHSFSCKTEGGFRCSP